MLLLEKSVTTFTSKRQTRIRTTWPSFPLTCRLLFIISTQISRFTQFFIHKNGFELFFLLIFDVYVKLKLSIREIKIHVYAKHVYVFPLFSVFSLLLLHKNK